MRLIKCRCIHPGRISAFSPISSNIEPKLGIFGGKMLVKRGIQISGTAVNPRSSGRRNDIDGLRAIAVLAVVLFHLDFRYLTGGFAGVDIFFVISGYLITGIVQREIVEGRFEVLRFYERRLRRIAPALLATMAAVFLCGLVFFMPDELRDLGASMLATAAFCSNFLFWMQADYFSGPVEFKALLHTWSLAVEEQYYIFAPPLMLLLHRWKPSSVKPVLAAICVVSFALSCAWVWIDPSGNYYLPHTRAWELLAGALVALKLFPALKSQTVAEAISAAGLGLLIFPLFALSAASAFPAWNAVPVCFGTAMVIMAGEDRQTWAGRLIGNPASVWIGLISYSLYLVHWPVIVFFKYQMLRSPDVIEKLALIALMTALAWASWKWVEEPFRNKARFSRSAIFKVALIGSAAVAVVGAGAFVAKGLPQRFGKEAQLAMREHGETADDPRAACFMKGSWRSWPGATCFLSEGTGGPVTMLWGDSHANHYSAAIANAQGLKSPVLLYASAGCAPIADVDFKVRPFCRENNDHAFDLIRQFHVKRIVMSAYWQTVLRVNDLSIAQLARTVVRLRRAGVDVRIVGENPDFAFANPAYLAARLARRPEPNADYFAEVRNDFEFNDQLQGIVGQRRFYNPMDDLCRKNKCLAYRDGHLMMIDNAHFSHFGADTVFSKMRPLFD